MGWENSICGEQGRHSATDRVGCLLSATEYHPLIRSAGDPSPPHFRAVEQFSTDVNRLKTQALEGSTGEMEPPSGQDRIYATVESRPDWCISRQRSWGVPLPVFYVVAGAILDPAWIRRVADLAWNSRHQRLV